MKKILITSALFLIVNSQIFALSTRTPVSVLTNFKSFVIVSSDNKKIPVVVSIPSFGNGFENGFAIQSDLDGELIKGYVPRKSGESQASSSLLFLAQPGASYLVYVDSDDLRKSSGVDSSLSALESKYVHPIKLTEIKTNPLYKERDIDSDGTPDIRDNCLTIANGSQVDLNNDGRGDECVDFDFDGIVNSSDNCINIPNKDQEDVDSDKMGDACDKIESRLTEKYPWLPWVGIGGAGLVLVILVALTAKDLRKRDETSV